MLLRESLSKRTDPYPISLFEVSCYVLQALGSSGRNFTRISEYFRKDLLSKELFSEPIALSMSAQRQQTGDYQVTSGLSTPHPG